MMVERLVELEAATKLRGAQTTMIVQELSRACQKRPLPIPPENGRKKKKPPGSAASRRPIRSELT
jgi:hypothetical protein